MHCENQYPEIGSIQEDEINLSVLKLMYIGQFVSDLSKFALTIQVGLFSVEINKNIDQCAKAFCSVVNQTFILYCDTWYPSRTFLCYLKYAQCSKKISNSKVCIGAAQLWKQLNHGSIVVLMEEAFRPLSYLGFNISVSKSKIGRVLEDKLARYDEARGRDHCRVHGSMPTLKNDFELTYFHLMWHLFNNC